MSVPQQTWRALVFDTETTGLPKSMVSSPWQHPEHQPRCVELSLQRINITADGLVQTVWQEPRTWLVQPEGWTIPEAASAVHGIDTETAREHGQPVREVLQQLLQELQSCDLLVAHNAQFDMKVLLADALRADMAELAQRLSELPALCTMLATVDLCKLPARYGRRGYKWPRLSELYMYIFGQPPSGALHRADADVAVTVSCLAACLAARHFTVLGNLRYFVPRL